MTDVSNMFDIVKAMFDLPPTKTNDLKFDWSRFKIQYFRSGYISDNNRSFRTFVLHTLWELPKRLSQPFLLPTIPSTTPNPDN